MACLGDSPQARGVSFYAVGPSYPETAYGFTGCPLVGLPRLLLYNGNNLLDAEKFEEAFFGVVKVRNEYFGAGINGYLHKVDHTSEGTRINAPGALEIEEDLRDTFVFMDLFTARMHCRRRYTIEVADDLKHHFAVVPMNDHALIAADVGLV